MMTVTQTDTNWFSVTLDGQWVGNVWSERGEWTAQDFDGDTDTGWQTMMGAADFTVQMARGAGFVR